LIIGFRFGSQFTSQYLHCNPACQHRLPPARCRAYHAPTLTFARFAGAKENRVPAAELGAVLVAGAAAVGAALLKRLHARSAELARQLSETRSELESKSSQLSELAEELECRSSQLTELRGELVTTRWVSLFGIGGVLERSAQQQIPQQCRLPGALLVAGIFRSCDACEALRSLSFAVASWRPKSQPWRCSRQHWRSSRRAWLGSERR
jgi:hypothetical protein